jgi:hypothetical protein
MYLEDQEREFIENFNIFNIEKQIRELELLRIN